MRPIFLLMLTIGILLSKGASAQQYLNLSVDNDLYFGLDRYYSSGIFVSTGKLKHEKEGAFPKKYLHWTLGQEIYTPKKRYTQDERQFDYPYGGWLFLEWAIEHYKSSFSSWGISLKIGMTGKASLAPFFQNLYHEKVLGLPDVTWAQALPQRFHLNLNGMHRKRLPIVDGLALMYELFGNLGTQRMALGGRLGLLLGNAQVLAFLGNPLEMQSKGFGVYCGTRQEYRFHDYMISGSLFDNDAPFVLTSIPYKNSLEAGLAFYGKKWRALTLWNSVSKDNERQVSPRHYYLNISITRLF